MVIALVYIGTILVAMAINPAAIVKTKQVVAITAIFQARWLRVLIELGALISMFGINVVIRLKPLIHKHFKNRCTTYVQRFYNLSNFDSIKLSDLRLYSSMK